jgi:exodeoxyribonuclease VII small subunit
MATKDSQSSEIKPSYEEARDELAEIVESLEDGSATLEESLKLWERGEELAKICQEWLDGAKKKLDAAKKPAASEAE